MSIPRIIPIRLASTRGNHANETKERTFFNILLVLLALYEDLYLTNKLLGILFRPSEVLLIGTQSMVPSEYRL